jgi:hypothetical protein
MVVGSDDRLPERPVNITRESKVALTTDFDETLHVLPVKDIPGPIEESKPGDDLRRPVIECDVEPSTGTEETR